MGTALKNKTDVERKVKSIIAYKLKVEEKKITSNSSFINDLDADFLGIVDLLMELEKEFKISIPDEQIEKISTVGQAIESVMNNGNKNMLNKVERLSSTSYIINNAI